MSTTKLPAIRKSPSGRYVAIDYVDALAHWLLDTGAVRLAGASATNANGGHA